MPSSNRPTDKLEDALPEMVRCDRAEFAKCRMKMWREVDASISEIDGENYFAVFVLPDDDYVQVYGDAERVTVEARVIENDGAFTHLVFGKGKLAKRKAYLGSANGPNGERVWADMSQMLTLDDARIIVREFLFHRKLSDRYVAEDVTERFLDDAGGWICNAMPEERNFLRHILSFVVVFNSSRPRSFGSCSSYGGSGAGHFL